MKYFLRFQILFAHFVVINELYAIPFIRERARQMEAVHSILVTLIIGDM